MKIVILGLSITSSWGNGHATTYRSLCRALHRRGHRIHFWEKDVPWYRSARDLPHPEYCRVRLYDDWDKAAPKILADARDADAVVLGSYFGDGIRAADALQAKCPAPVLFYDIDTPVTMAALESQGGCEYLRRDQIPGFQAYLSFSGGRVLECLRKRFGARYPVAFYCSVDPDAYQAIKGHSYPCDLSYLGTYSPDRQEKLDRLLGGAARQLQSQHFVIAGSQYPETIWPDNVERVEHVPPPEHAAFYSSSRFTLNLTRADMVQAGYSPSVRLFEAAACGAAIVSDPWEGIAEFLEPGREVVLVEQTEEVINILTSLSEKERLAMGSAARDRILSSHTARHRAEEFEHVMDVLSAKTHGSRQRRSSREETQYAGDSAASSEREKVPVATAIAGN